MFTIDYSKAKEFASITDGTYETFIEKAVQDATKNGADFINIHFRIRKDFQQEFQNNIDGFKSSERKIYRCSLADDEFRSGRLETFHFVEDNLDDYILRQSTGLFDKNGVEIFEGDVVKLQYTITSDLEFFKVNQFRGGSWRIDNRRRGSDLWLRNEDCEVIGNIYQNSDLIESVEE
ncbi:TPA: YopX family protein [Streptococcus pyogenes]|uniref:YopX family protein n=1 Tax=Streptococcus pyogenes TaxID=1314 RepID=UPI0011BD2090|nr:YopX family protein [Streptococcus pyogenes]TYL19872.1 DUF669 domain-containing protein [Streptococcus pyogenes]HEP6390756.1 DUF669 domain-containing protein [Streptococcus pyogenes]HEP6634089.1 DUF669 domain-containing protein [Streptococcus pyogenes]HEP6770134.1 DUF669 domain-containing protein [Streptococcus pyogenes]HEP7017192.1 DUF669 domain-containing protein [Streptococcus pyogenes]